MAYGEQTERQQSFLVLGTRKRGDSGGKYFELQLRENRRGRYVVTTEFSNGHRNSVVMPVEILRGLIQDLQDLADEAGH